MAHELRINENGQADMMYFGEKPWHGLGTELANPATAEEAIKYAGLDFEVVKVPLFIYPDSPISVPGQYATVRTDTNDVLGVVGERYNPLQNSEAFGFFDPLVDRDEAMYHTAGTLGKGERIWIMAKLPDYISVKGDQVDKFVLLASSHDGSGSIIAKFTPIRVVCNNTLSAALAGKSDTVKIRHTRTMKDRLAEAHRVLGLSNKIYDQLDAIFNQMAETKITDEAMKTYIINSLTPDNKSEEEKEEMSTRLINITNRVIGLTEEGMGMNHEATKGTLWGAYNALTEYADHHKVVRGDDANARLTSIWFGTSEFLKNKAFSLAVQMLAN